ncbi:hypothetical protein ACET3Z_013439 [Daucus carota]
MCEIATRQLLEGNSGNMSGSSQQLHAQMTNMKLTQMPQSSSQHEPLPQKQLQQDDIEHIGDGGDVDSFLSNDGEDGRTLYDNIKQNLTEHKTESSKDVRFRPNSSQLLTASLDKSVKLWDAANPSYCLHAYTGHPSHVMSLDFHPKKNDMFSFCDSNNEIRYWNINPFSCTRVSKQGGSSQVRFEPANGRLLAAASDEVVSIFDVETDTQTHLFQGHRDVVNSLCWDLNGDYLDSISKESVKVWSLTSGECVHELRSKRNQFHSCAFHSSYSALLMIGGNKGLELWNIAENKSMTV